MGITHNRATRWLKIGVEFQPSEVAKIGVVLFFAARLCKREQYKKKPSKKPVQQAGGADPPLLVLVGAQRALAAHPDPGGRGPSAHPGPHLSATILIFAAAAAILFAAGVKLFWFALGGGLGAVGVWLLLVVVGYNGSRIEMWKNPWADPGDKGIRSSSPSTPWPPAA